MLVLETPVDSRSSIPTTEAGEVFMAAARVVWKVLKMGERAKSKRQEIWPSISRCKVSNVLVPAGIERDESGNSRLHEPHLVLDWPKESGPSATCQPLCGCVPRPFPDGQVGLIVEPARTLQAVLEASTTNEWCRDPTSDVAKLPLLGSKPWNVVWFSMDPQVQ